MEKTTVNQREASKLLGVSPITIKRWVASGKLRCIKVGDRKLTYFISDLEKMRQVINPETENNFSVKNL